MLRVRQFAPMAFAAAVVVGILSSCTSTETPPPPLAPATSSPNALSVTPSPTPTVIPNNVGDVSEPMSCTPLRSDYKPKISGERQQIPVDSGPRTGATGQALLDSDGTPVAYVVAADDIPDFISDRFCIGLAYLNNVNGPRRGGAIVLYAGDILNFDAETVTTVGDINGDVEDYSLPAPLPPQHAPEFTPPSR